MGWGWKLAGAVVGGSIGGPVGAAVGAALGHALDTNDKLPTQNPPHGLTRQSHGARNGTTALDTPSHLGLYAYAAFLADVAQADNEFDPRERALAFQLCREIGNELGLEPRDDELVRLIHRASTDKSALEWFISIAKRDQDFQIFLLRSAWRMAAKDGSINDFEVQRIWQLALKMDASKEAFYFAMALYHRPTSVDEIRRAAAETLGVSTRASESEIKTAFRKLSMKHHPDRQLNARPEARRLAGERFATISAAYRTLLNTPHFQLLYGSVPDTSMVSTAFEGDIVACFVCAQKCRMPARGYHTSARCPKCQCLLLFEAEIADVLTTSVPK